MNFNIQEANENRASLLTLPPDLSPKIERLALILQQSITDGRLTDREIQHALAQGDLMTLIKALGPEASELAEDIRASLQANHSGAALSSMLEALMTSAQGQSLMK